MPPLAKSSPPRSAPAFTIMELLVVILIVILLMAIIIPTISAAQKAAKKTANFSTLTSLQNALNQYYNDFNAFPPSASANVSNVQVYTPIKPGRGSAMLAEALMGYLQGKTVGTTDGAGSLISVNDPHFGFRTRSGGLGKIYGPYASDDPKSYKVNIIDPAPPAVPAFDDEVFIDAYGNEILYFKALGNQNNPKLTQIFSSPATTSIIGLFNDNDNANDYLGFPRQYPIATKPLDGSAPMTNLLPLPSVTYVSPAPSNTPSFFHLLYNRPLPTTPPTIYDKYDNKNDITPGSGTPPAGPVLGADSYLLISAGPDGIYYNADDVVVSHN